jgi:phenylpropionate dioxygenase-like ring-hydroxylating dioxygenase large terminal subunit
MPVFSTRIDAWRIAYLTVARLEDDMAVNAAAALRRKGFGSPERPLTKDLWSRDSHPSCAAMEEPGDYEPEHRHVDYHRYYEANYASREFERMWNRTWLFACREEDIPQIGDRLPFDVGPISLIIAHAGPEQFKAFYNSCPHRGTKLCDKSTSGLTIKCPYHFWEWKLDGSLQQIPSFWDFADLDRKDAQLREVKLDRWGGYIFINCDPEAQPLREVLSVVPKHFEAFGSEDRYTAAHFRKVVPANWKIAMEAFQEAYHLPAIHPQATPFSGDSQSQYDIWSAGGGHVGRVVTPSAIPGMAAAPDATALTASIAYSLNMQSWRHPDAALPELDPSGDLRAQLAHWHRDLQLQTYGRKVDAPDSVMVDAMLYYMFPNLILWLSETVPFVYRFLPHANDPELSYFEGRMLLPYPAHSDPPEPAPCVEIGVEESIAEMMPAFGFTGGVLDQDMDNMRRVQAGVKAADTRRRHSQLGRYQEMIIQRWNELLDQYLAE